MNNMLKGLSGLLAGLLFGLGLAVSGMTDTQKVLGFLDLFGEWDYSLALVMAAGLAVTVPAYYLTKGKQPWFEKHFSLPDLVKLDARLLSGAAIFGIGWGIYGYCPGPAVASLGYGSIEAVVFVLTMIVGMFLADKIAPR